MQFLAHLWIGRTTGVAPYMGDREGGRKLPLYKHAAQVPPATANSAIKSLLMRENPLYTAEQLR